MFCTSLNGSLPSLIERMLSVSQPRLGPDHHGDFQLVRTLPLSEHRVKVVCYLKRQTNANNQSRGGLWEEMILRQSVSTMFLPVS